MTQRGQPTEGNAAATIAEVARLANVSETTVSLAFQEKSRISDATRKRVQEVARRLRYVPNQHARSLRAGRTRLLGLLVNDLVNPFYARLAELVEELVEERGYQLLVFNSRWSAKREMAAVRRMAEFRMEGVLACFSESTAESRRFLVDNAIPYISLDTEHDGSDGAYVLFDLKLAGRLAAAHFAELGCRRPALLMPAASQGPRFSAFEHLEIGFGEEWARRGGAADGILHMSAELTIPSGKESFSRLHRSNPGVDSVLCANDLAALGVIDAADQLGLRVGERLAVMGIDNLPMGAIARLGLTTVREPVETLARLAATALMDGVENREEVTIRQLIEPELIMRASTLRFQRPRA